MTLQTRDYPLILLLGASGRVSTKANRSPLSLYFLCCFRCVHTDTEQVGQGSSKAILCCLNTSQNGCLQTRVRIQHRQVTLEAENYRRTVRQEHTKRNSGLSRIFSNPQLPFPNIHLSETSLFQTVPASLLCHLSPSSPVACPEMNGSDGDRVLLSYPVTVGQAEEFAQIHVTLWAELSIWPWDHIFFLPICPYVFILPRLNWTESAGGHSTTSLRTPGLMCPPNAHP